MVEEKTTERKKWTFEIDGLDGMSGMPVLFYTLWYAQESKEIVGMFVPTHPYNRQLLGEENYTLLTQYYRSPDLDGFIPPATVKIWERDRQILNDWVASNTGADALDFINPKLMNATQQFVQRWAEKDSNSTLPHDIVWKGIRIAMTQAYLKMNTPRMLNTAFHMAQHGDVCIGFVSQCEKMILSKKKLTKNRRYWSRASTEEIRTALGRGHRFTVPEQIKDRMIPDALQAVFRELDLETIFSNEHTLISSWMDKEIIDNYVDQRIAETQLILGQPIHGRKELLNETVEETNLVSV